MKRPKGMDYKEYRKGLRLITEARRKYLKGRLFWNSFTLGTYKR